MRMVRRFLGALLVLVGGVWFFQGIGVIGGSPMTDEPLWIFIGAVVVLAGLGLFVWRGRPPAER